MKSKRRSSIIKNAICLSIACVWWISTSLPCLFLFGEYPYPEETK